MMLVFHVTTEREWRTAMTAGSYEGSTWDQSLAEVGFVHCSFGVQVRDVLATFYADAVEPLVLLTVDTDRVGVPCRVEDGFPHLYGAIPCSAVVDTQPVDANVSHI